MKASLPMSVCAAKPEEELSCVTAETDFAVLFRAAGLTVSVACPAVQQPATPNTAVNPKSAEG